MSRGRAPIEIRRRTAGVLKAYQLRRSFRGWRKQKQQRPSRGILHVPIDMYRFFYGFFISQPVVFCRPLLLSFCFCFCFYTPDIYLLFLFFSIIYTVYLRVMLEESVDGRCVSVDNWRKRKLNTKLTKGRSRF